MTDYGVTVNGFLPKTFSILRSEVQERARGTLGLPNLDLSDPAGFVSSLYLPLLEQLAEVWAVGELVYNAPDPRRSTGQSYGVVAELRGTPRKVATRGTHPGVNITFDGAVPDTIRRGAIRFHPEGDSSNVWMNVSDLTVSGAGVRVIECESELTGSSKFLNEDAPIEILDGPSQMTLIEIPSDANAGTDLESETAWRQRSERATDPTQTRVGSALEALDGVVSARIVESPGYITAFVDYPEGTIADNTIAQTILDAKAEGVQTLGVLSGIATDGNGDAVNVRFSRVASVSTYVQVTVFSPTGASTTAIKDAIIAAGPKRAGDPLIWSKVNGAVSAVPGVEDVRVLLIRRETATFGTTNVIYAQNERCDIDPADIAVTVSTS